MLSATRLKVDLTVHPECGAERPLAGLMFDNGQGFSADQPTANERSSSSGLIGVTTSSSAVSA